MGDPQLERQVGILAAELETVKAERDQLRDELKAVRPQLESHIRILSVALRALETGRGGAPDGESVTGPVTADGGSVIRSPGPGGDPGDSPGSLPEMNAGCPDE